MQVVIQSEGIQVIGELQNEDISFGISNDYEAPFESSGNVMSDLVVQFLNKGRGGKFKYMFSQFWRSATPPSLEITIGLLAEENGQTEVMDVINTLQDMFATKLVSGRLVPPGGVSIDTSWTKAANSALDAVTNGGVSAVGQAIDTLYNNSVNRNRLVDVYLGGETASIKFRQLLPDRLGVRGMLPVMTDGAIGRAIITCSFINPNILTVGERFIGG